MYTEAIWYFSWSLSTYSTKTALLAEPRMSLVTSKVQQSSSRGRWGYWCLGPRSDFLLGCWGFELRSSSLHSKCSYPLNHLPSPALYCKLEVPQKGVKGLREAFITSWKLVLFVINEKPWLRKWDWNTILSVPSGLLSLPQKREISTGEMTWHFDAKVRGTNFEGPKVLKDVTRESLSPSAAQSLAHSRGYANIWSAAEYVIQRFLPHLELSFKAVT